MYELELVNGICGIFHRERGKTAGATGAWGQNLSVHGEHHTVTYLWIQIILISIIYHRHMWMIV